MPWFPAILLGLLAGAIGGAYAGFVASRAVSWLRISSFEGASAHAVVGLALLGFGLGTILGIAACRIAGGDGAAGMARGFGAALLVVIGVVSTAGALAWASREQALPAGAQPLDLAVEVRMPEGSPRPAPHREGASHVDLRAARGGTGTGGMLRLAEAREEDGRWIVPATIPIQSVAVDHMLSVRQPQQETLYVPITLAAPTAADGSWSAWITAEGAAPSRSLGIRHRVVARGPAADEQRRAAFAAVPANAPAAALLPFLSAAWPDGIREEAIRRILARPDHVGLLANLIATADHEGARDAMFVVGSLHPGSSDFAAPVTARIEEVLRIAATIDLAAPDSRQRLYAETHVLVTGIVAAAAGLWRAGVDLRPGLRAIADAARPREQHEPRHLADDVDALVARLDALERGGAGR